MPTQLTTERQPLAVPRAWYRGRNALEQANTPEPRLPDPARLYGLVVMAFVFHVPDEHGDAVLTVCRSCREPWPCDQVRLAFRLREAF
ncbi:hypothetical protein [Haloechinothrix salitolerans]|uniref:Uncharacterized protein n=1 Tax=Haloechinothrix salitolerans TaxID=926830 RepID=A0ABW2BXW4_9PSEU